MIELADEEEEEDEGGGGVAEEEADEVGKCAGWRCRRMAAARRCTRTVPVCAQIEGGDRCNDERSDGESRGRVSGVDSRQQGSTARDAQSLPPLKLSATWSRLCTQRGA